MNFEAIYNNELGVFTYEKKWLSISSGISSEKAGPADVSFVIANGPITIPAYSNHNLAFAMVTGDDSLSLFENADSARAMWDKIMILDIEPEKKSQRSLSFGLSQNYPNPFYPKKIINYELQITNFVELNIYDIVGRKVATLLSGKKLAGRHRVEWDPPSLLVGYIFTLLPSPYKFVGRG
jgi:hypothetical protein